MVTISGEALHAGDTVVNLEIKFPLKRSIDFESKTEENTFCSREKVHDADIENKLMLGYPWLEENALACLWPAKRDFVTRTGIPPKWVTEPKR